LVRPIGLKSDRVKEPIGTQLATNQPQNGVDPGSIESLEITDERQRGHEISGFEGVIGLKFAIGLGVQSCIAG
jgi:hypothetical protein